VTIRQVVTCLFVLIRSRAFGHILDVEGFDSDQTITIDQLSSGLVNKVVASVGNTLMDSTHHLLGLVPRLRAVLVFDLSNLR